MSLTEHPTPTRTSFLRVGAPTEQFAEHLVSTGSAFDRVLEAPSIEASRLADAQIHDGTWFAMARPLEVPAALGGGLIVGTRQGTVRLGADGEVVWEAPGESVDALACVGFHVFAGDRGGVLRCLAIDGGVELWRQRSEDWISAIGSTVDGDLLVSSRDGSVRLLDAAQGMEIWSTRRAGRVLARAATSETQACIGARDGVVALFDLRTGSVVAEIETGSDVHATAVADEDGRFYVGSDDKRLYCLEADGSIRWAFRTGDAIWAEPILQEYTVVVASTDGNVYAVDRSTGVPVWSAWTGGSVRLASARCGNEMYVVTEAGVATVIDLASGAVTGTVDLGAGVWAPPTVASEGVVVATFANELVRVRRSDA